MTKPIVRILLPSPNHTSSSEPSSPKSLIVPLLNGQDLEDNKGSYDVSYPTSLRMLLSTPSPTVHHYWRDFDDAFMRPVFGGRGFVPFIPGSPTEGSLLQWQQWGEIFNECMTTNLSRVVHEIGFSFSQRDFFFFFFFTSQSEVVFNFGIIFLVYMVFQMRLCSR